MVGANILNLLWVIGAAAMVKPLTIDPQTMFFNIPVAIFFSVLMLLFGMKDGKFYRISGIILLTFYLAYIIVLFRVLYRG